MKTLLGIVVAVFVFFPSSSFACDEYIDFSDEQAVQLLGKLKTLDQGNHQAIFEFDRLLCAKRKILRDSARQAGRQASIPAIRSRALQSTLFEKDVLNFVVLTKENMTKAEQEFRKNSPLITYRVTHIDREKGCMGIRYRDCRPDYLLSVTGSEVDLNSDRARAKLRLAEDGNLRGLWSNGNSNAPISMPVELRLD
jgi:hypothetical protein